MESSVLQIGEYEVDTFVPESSLEDSWDVFQTWVWI